MPGNGVPAASVTTPEIEPGWESDAFTAVTAPPATTTTGVANAWDVEASNHSLT